MIATEMLDAHSRAIQRQLRHSFHREYEHRIEIFSDRLGISSALTAEVAALHRALDGIFSAIRRYEEELAAARAENADAELRTRVDEIAAQRDEVKGLAERIVYQRFSILAGLCVRPKSSSVRSSSSLHLRSAKRMLFATSCSRSKQ